MLHPSPVAVKYIWDKLQEVYVGVCEGVERERRKRERERERERERDAVYIYMYVCACVRVRDTHTHTHTYIHSPSSPPGFGQRCSGSKPWLAPCSIGPLKHPGRNS